MQNPTTAAPRVLILGATFATDNMGVGALASGAISIVAHRFPGAQISFLDYGRTPTRSPVTVHGRSFEVPLVNLRFSWKVFLRNNIVYLLAVAALGRLLGDGFVQRASRSNRWIRAIREADLALAVSGGDSFSDIYGLGRFFYVYLPQLLVLWLGRPLVQLPQTIGPFAGHSARTLARRLLARTRRIYTRERSGVEELQSLVPDAGERARFCYDMGFVLEPRRPGGRQLDELMAARKDGRPLVGLNVSGLLMIGGYERNNAFALKIDYPAFVEQAIAFLIREKGANVVLVPHVFGHQTESDTAACAAVFEKLKATHAGRLFCLGDDFDQNEIKFAIGQCDFFIGARMHACIAALSQGIPAIGIAYSQKFLGVFETVNVGSLVADPRRLTAPEILAVIGDAMDRREQISSQLKQTMVQVRQDLYATMDGIA